MRKTIVVAALLAGVLCVTGLAAQGIEVPRDAAVVTVKVPPTAKLLIGDSPTQQTGSQRTFQSPRLEAGKRYTYLLKIAWVENGKAMSAEKSVEVEAGKLASVDFTLPDNPAAPAAVAANPAAPATNKPAAANGPKTREFFFTYRATVTGLELDKTARVWLPLATSSDDQEVNLVREEAPGPSRVAREPKYGNSIYYVEGKAKADGTLSVALAFKVKRKEVKSTTPASADEASQIELFLKPDSKVPIGGKPQTLIEGKELPKDQLALGKLFYEVVNNHMKYSKEGTGWGQGDAEWACDSRFGNCTDFHSLFISLARTSKMPAKFEMGFPIPDKRGQGEVAGYHCWAKFKPDGKGWIPVDISEANKFPDMKEYYFGNLTESRVAFTVGRDLTLVPKQDGPTLNFFVYPYVEVDGKPYPNDKVKRQFTYEDLEAAK